MAMLKDLINQLTNNKVVYAKIIDVTRGQASVKLVGSDARLSNLDVVGGTVVANQRVIILWDGKKPYVHVGANTESTVSTVAAASQVQDGALEQVYNQEDVTNTILLFDLSGTQIMKYPITATGFGDALTDAEPGDIISIPPATITGDHTIGDDIRVVGRSRYSSIFTGKITGGDGASIENLSIIRAINDSSALVGVSSPATGTFYINDCDIEVDQSGSGAAYALSADVADSIIEVWNSFLSANSDGGTGYGAYRNGTSASAYIYGGRVYGSSGSVSE